MVPGLAVWEPTPVGMAETTR